MSVECANRPLIPMCTEVSLMLTGIALRSEAARLAIPGRSKMTATELRAAIAARLCPFRAATSKHKRRGQRHGWR